MSTHSLTKAALRAEGLPRRRATNRLMELLAWLAAAVAMGFLVLIVWSVARRGWSELNLDLITKSPATGFLTTGRQGLANAFAGTLVIVLLATLMALPTGILVAVYLNEFAQRAIRDAVSIALDVLNGVPAIVIGIFVYGLFVLGHGPSAFAGSFALAVIMLPLVARSTMEVLALVPGALREASLALGVPRWRTTLSVVLPQTVGGIVTGTTLAVARAAGETAPLLFTSSVGVGTQVHWSPHHPLQSVPVAIFELSESPDPKDHARAWAAALVLLVFILLASLSARWLATRHRSRLGTSR
jgi:phosphate transport system permease protein